MDLRRLAYFLAVVEHGSVTAAAAALHLAQPSLSQSIRSLERDLGVELFARGLRGMTLTATGEALVGPARLVLADLSAARAAVDEVVELSSGWLDLVVHDLLAVDPVAAVLAAFHRRHPGVPVRLHSPRDEDELVRLIVDGRCELGLTYLPVAHTGLRVRALGTQSVWLVLPPGSRDLPDPLPVKALDGMALVDGARGFEALRAAIRAALRAESVTMRPVVRSGHREAIVPLVLAGAGAAFTNEWYARDAARAGAVVRRLDPPIAVDYALLHREGALSPAARELVRMLSTYPADRPAP